MHGKILQIRPGIYFSKFCIIDSKGTGAATIKQHGVGGPEMLGGQAEAKVAALMRKQKF